LVIFMFLRISLGRVSLPRSSRSTILITHTLLCSVLLWVIYYVSPTSSRTWIRLLDLGVVFLLLFLIIVQMRTRMRARSFIKIYIPCHAYADLLLILLEWKRAYTRVRIARA
jgi:hypothetical protein